MHTPKRPITLREKTVKGGALMVLRQGFGMTLSLISVLIVTRIIGPRQYGLYAASIGIVMFLTNFGVWGLDVYLLRKPEEPTLKEYNQALTLLLAGAALTAAGLTALSRVITGAIRLPGAAPILAVLGCSLFFSLGAVPFIVRLDRELNFRRVAINEVVSQTSSVAISLILAIRGAGAWAPAIGYMGQQLVLLVLNVASVRAPIRLEWDSTLIRRMLGTGLTYSSSIFVWQLRSLVNPVIVARLAGAEAVAFVALAIRITEVLAFAKTATYRIAMAALAKLRNDPVRLRRSISEGMRLQAIAVGLPLTLFAIVSPLVLGHVFGDRWLPALIVLPFVMLSYLTNSMFNLHSSVLYLIGRNNDVTLFHVVHVVLFAGSAIAFVPIFGFRGYGFSEAVALLSYFVIERFIKAQVGAPEYKQAAVWYGSCVIVFALALAGAPWIYLGTLVVPLPFLFSKQRADLYSYADLVFRRAANAA